MADVPGITTQSHTFPASLNFHANYFHLSARSSCHFTGPKIFKSPNETLSVNLFMQMKPANEYATGFWLISKPVRFVCFECFYSFEWLCQTLKPLNPLSLFRPKKRHAGVNLTITIFIWLSRTPATPRDPGKRRRVGRRSGSPRVSKRCQLQRSGGWMNYINCVCQLEVAGGLTSLMNVLNVINN